MHVLVTCTNEEVPIKSEGTRVVTTFLPLKVYGDFSAAQGQLIRSPWLDLAEFLTYPKLYDCPFYLHK